MDGGTSSYSRDRLKFILYVYLLSLIWLGIAMAQWLILNLLPIVGGVFQKPGISFFFFTIGILLVVALILASQLNIMWLNWILTVLAIEFGILGMAALVVRSLWPELLLWIFLSSLLIVVCVVLNIYLPCDLTKNAFVLHVISSIIFFGSIFILMMYVIKTSLYFGFIVQILLSAIVIMFVLHNAQAVSGGRFEELVLEDFLLPSIVFFYHFIMLFLLSFSAHQFKLGTRTMVAIGLLNPSLLDKNEKT
ncbi:uncharacterized protein LOC135431305 [Drosophila montana]|uniref:uncharacterized protein LOC135431305 n=1 Tax=Drosophila montana TaxID=40370 RepID=UPI00313AA9C5